MHRKPKKGECVVVARNSVGHSFTVGDRLVVNQVDANDDTLRGTPLGTTTMSPAWLPWRDAEPVQFGWEYARERLPAETVTMLEACEGVEHLALNSLVKAAIVDSLPDWKNRLLRVLTTGDCETKDAEAAAR